MRLYVGSSREAMAGEFKPVNPEIWGLQNLCIRLHYLDRARNGVWYEMSFTGDQLTQL